MDGFHGMGMDANCRSQCLQPRQHGMPLPDSSPSTAPLCTYTCAPTGSVALADPPHSPAHPTPFLQSSSSSTSGLAFASDSWIYDTEPPTPVSNNSPSTTWRAAPLLPPSSSPFVGYYDLVSGDHARNSIEYSSEAAAQALISIAPERARLPTASYCENPCSDKCSSEDVVLCPRESSKRLQDCDGLCDRNYCDEIDCSFSPCRWTVNGQPCDTAFPDQNALAHHVLADHVAGSSPESHHHLEPSMLQPSLSHYSLGEDRQRDPGQSSWSCVPQCGLQGYVPSDSVMVPHNNPSSECHWGACHQVLPGTTDLTKHLFSDHFSPHAQYDFSKPFSGYDTSDKMEVDNSMFLTTSHVSGPSGFNGAEPQMDSRDTEILGADASQTECSSPCTTANTSSITPSPISPPPEGLMCKWHLEPNGCQCSFRCRGRTDLQKHIVSTHIPPKPSKGDEKQGVFLCQWEGCRNSTSKHDFGLRQNLIGHIATHSKYKAVRCPKCYVEFCNKKGLESHMATHTGERQYKCPECNRDFKHPSSLQAHRRSHQEGPKTYKCEICGHGDNDHSNFKRHLQTHEAPRFGCEKCGYKTSKKGNLRRHLKSCQGKPKKPAKSRNANFSTWSVNVGTNPPS